MAKVLIFDCETSHLRADFGTLLAFGYKWLGAKSVKVPSLIDRPGKNPIDDSLLVAEAHRVLSSADILVSYFGKGFDIKWLQAKFLEHGLQALPSIPHVDLYFTVKANLAISRRSLANLGYYLSLKSTKTPVSGRVWKLAAIGDKGALTYVRRHCRSDVLLLEEAYLKLRPLVRLHPRVSGYGPCAVCAGPVQRRGRAYTRTKGEQYRFQCTSCGTWETRSDR